MAWFELILAVGTVLAELVEAGVGVADLGLRLDQPVAALQGGRHADDAGPGIAAAVALGGFAIDGAAD